MLQNYMTKNQKKVTIFKRKNQLTDVNPKMTQMLELSE